ncbi:MAG TPA: DUF2059 domain-containing protein [Aquabacterium sp.]|nr:DUF2059 domain-containing protein [Aquabacterium sp.]
MMVFTRFSRRAVIGSLAVAAALVSVVTPAQAQPISEEKQKLIQKILTLWHPEDIPVMMVQRRATDAMQQSRIALQGKVTAEKRDATMRDIATDVQKYVDEVTPIAKDSAKRQISPVIVPMLAQNFSEEELKQIIALLESPVKKKFEQFIPQAEKALGTKVAEDTHVTVDAKGQAMAQAVGLKLRAAVMAGGGQ